MGNVSGSARERKVFQNESTWNVRTEQLAMFPRLLLFFSVYFFTLIM